MSEENKKNADKIKQKAIDIEEAVGDIKEIKTSAEKKREAVKDLEKNPGRKIDIE